MSNKEPERECCEECRTSIMLPVVPPMMKCQLDYHCHCHGQPSSELAKTLNSFAEHVAKTPPQEKVEEDWEKYLEMGGEIIDYEGELRPEGVNKIKLLIEHLLASTKKETLEEVIRMLDDEYISRPHIKRMLTDLCNRLGI